MKLIVSPQASICSSGVTGDLELEAASFDWLHSSRLAESFPMDAPALRTADLSSVSSTFQPVDGWPLV